MGQQEVIKKMIQAIMNRLPELTTEDIKQKIVDKKEKIGSGYITDEGALFLIASDYNCNNVFGHLYKFDENGIYQMTGTKYDEGGFDIEGNNENGFDVNGIHKVTGTEYDEGGKDKEGFDVNGIHKVTGTEYDEGGKDKEGFDVNGFDVNGIHKVTGTEYDEGGKDIHGLSKEDWAAREITEKELHEELNNNLKAENDAEIEKEDRRIEEEEEQEYHNEEDPYTEVETNCLTDVHENEAEK
jgi:hypothetical protein